MTFEEALANFVAEVGQMTGRRGAMGRTAPTPQSVPGPTGGPEMRAYEPSAGESISALARKYIGGTTGERVAPVAGAVMDYGPMPAQIATDVAMQPVRAGQAVADAVEAPSLGRVTNAGAQTALAMFQPAKALGALGAGFGLAGADQLGLNPISEATADQAPANADVLDPDQRAEYEGAMQAIAKGRFKSGAERRSLEAVRDRYETILREAALVKIRNAGAGDAAKVAAEQEEYDRAVLAAETSRNKAKERDIRFADTPVGQFYDDMGGAATIAPIVALGSGAISRAATGPGEKGIDALVKQYLLPGGMGAVEGAAINNIPNAYDIKRAPAYNPEKEAYQAYARDLPSNHPRKQEFADYAASLGDVNPVVKAAKESAGQDLLVSNAWPALEGGVAAILGAKGVGVAGRLRRGEFRSQKPTQSEAPAPAPTGGPQPSPVSPTSGGSPPAAIPPPGTPAPTGGPPTAPKKPRGGGPQSTTGNSSPTPWQYQKRGKDGKFKKGFSFKPRGAANQSADSIANLGKSAITKPKTP